MPPHDVDDVDAGNQVLQERGGDHPVQSIEAAPTGRPAWPRGQVAVLPAAPGTAAAAAVDKANMPR